MRRRRRPGRGGRPGRRLGPARPGGGAASHPGHVVRHRVHHEGIHGGDGRRTGRRRPAGVGPPAPRLPARGAAARSRGDRPPDHRRPAVAPVRPAGPRPGLARPPGPEPRRPGAPAAVPAAQQGPAAGVPVLQPGLPGGGAHRRGARRHPLGGLPAIAAAGAAWHGPLEPDRRRHAGRSGPRQRLRAPPGCRGERAGAAADGDGAGRCDQLLRRRRGPVAARPAGWRAGGRQAVMSPATVARHTRRTYCCRRTGPSPRPPGTPTVWAG